MLMNITFLLQSFKSQLDSTFHSLEKVPPETLLSFNNPVFLSLFLTILILSIILIYYRFVVVPLRIKFIEEKQALQMQHTEMMALFSELSPDPVIRCDISGRILLSNESANDIFNKKILLGEYIENVFPIIKNFDIEKVIDYGLIKNFEHTVDGKHFQFVVAGVPKYNAIQIYGRDISQLKTTQQELKVALTKANASTKLKEEFLSRISHEIRSPLVSIQGYSELLKSQSDEFSPEYQNIFQSIENNSKRLYRTVELILNMSQVQTGSYESSFKEINIYNVVEKTFREFKSFADESKLDFSFDSQVDTETSIFADEYSVSQIVVNLIDNAFKYTRKGSISVGLYKENQSVKIVVEDSGVGISEKYLNNLFQPFSQEYSGYTRPYDGTGLGLALVKSFIDLNEAKIEVNSEINRGAKFIVTFDELIKL